jgi:hypothetical protein
MRSRTVDRRLIKRSSRNHDGSTATANAGHRTSTISAEPLGKAACRHMVISLDRISSRLPSELKWLNVDIAREGSTGGLATPRAMTMYKLRRRRFYLEAAPQRQLPPIAFCDTAFESRITIHPTLVAGPTTPFCLIILVIDQQDAFRHQTLLFKCEQYSAGSKSANCDMPTWYRKSHRQGRIEVV